MLNWFFIPTFAEILTKTRLKSLIMRKLAFIVGSAVLVLSSCKKYDYSEGEMSTVDPKFVQINNYAIPATTITLENDYVDSLDTVNFSNGLTDTIPLVIDNPYNIPFSFTFDVATAPSGSGIVVYDMTLNQLDKMNLNNNDDTLLVVIDPGPLNIGESRTLNVFVKHQDYQIRVNHYTAYREN